MKIRQPTAQQLLALKGTSVPVPELLALFGVRVRNYQTVPLIQQALKDAGLATVPSFAHCGSRAAVHVVPREPAQAAAEAEEEADGGEELPKGGMPQHSFRIDSIPSARGGVVSVPSDAPLAQATHLMRTNNYSQLPVIDGVSHLRGVVTWSSVAARYETGAQPVTLAGAMVTESLPVAEVHQDLFPLLPTVSRDGYLLVRDNSGRIAGIVTDADITGRFEATARPFFIVGEIEFRLRKCLGAKLGAEAIRKVQQKKPEKQTGNVADLMFGDYVKLLNGDTDKLALREAADVNWRTLGWTGVDRTQFVHQLDRVRQIRNQIAHFDAEPLKDGQMEELTQFAGLLKQLVV